MFDSFNLELSIILIQFIESLHRRGVNMSLNMHIKQYGLTQNNKILQNIELIGYEVNHKSAT